MACRLLRDLLPGPVTVVLRRRADAPLSPDLNPGVATIGRLWLARAVRRQNTVVCGLHTRGATHLAVPLPRRGMHTFASGLCFHFSARNLVVRSSANDTSEVLPTGVRVPDNGFARDVCRGAGGALALTSANISGATSPLQVRN